MKITKSYLKQLILEELESDEQTEKKLTAAQVAEKISSILPKNNEEPVGASTFGEAVAMVVKNDYGNHNVEDFKAALLKNLITSK